VVLIVLPILIVLIEVLFVIDLKIVLIMLMKPIVNTVSWFFFWKFYSYALTDNHRQPISFQSKIILFTVLLMIISFDIFSILICYFCCGISNRNRLDLKERKSGRKRWENIWNFILLYLAPTIMEEGAAAVTPLLQSTNSKTNNQSNWMMNI